MQICRAALFAAAGDIVATAAAFDPVETFIGLAQGITDIGLNANLTDIVPGTGNLAVRKEVTTWAGPFALADGSPYYESPLMTWIPASSADAQIIVGFYLATLITAGVLMGYGVFPAPIQVVDATTPINFVMRLVLDATGQWSAEIVFSS
jgi:hypothetical protein